MTVEEYVDRKARFIAITEPDLALVLLFGICFSLIFEASGRDYLFSVCQEEDYNIVPWPLCVRGGTIRKGSVSPGTLRG